MKLSKEQLAAIRATESNVIVVAPAGSGKTLVLTERVRHLIENGVSPSNIICITFTNLAAEEMRDRLSEVPGIDRTYIGTIHALAASVYGDTGANFTIRTKEVETSLIQEILMPNIFEQNQSIFNLSHKRYIEYLNYVEDVANGIIPDVVKTNKDLAPEFFTKKEYKGYVLALDRMIEVCKERNIISFDELIKAATKHFDANGSVIEHMLVDEYQDTSREENSFIMGLAAKNNFFVGDDWQSIYSFKGSSMRLFTDLIDNPDYTVYYLKDNYRSKGEIIRAANSLLPHMGDVIYKEVRGTRSDGATVKMLRPMEFTILLSKIKKEGGFGKWFVLTRTNKEVEDMISRFSDNGISAKTFRREGLTRAELAALIDDNSVKVLTVHSAKGLENDNVILYGSFPDISGKQAFGDQGEENRIKYVGMTRARDNLYIFGRK